MGLAAYQAAVLADSPAAWWQCQDASGSLDDSISGRDGSSVGAAKTYHEPGPASDCYSIHFPGSASAGFSVPDENLWDSKPKSVEGWVRLDPGVVIGGSGNPFYRGWMQKGRVPGLEGWNIQVILDPRGGGLPYAYDWYVASDGGVGNPVAYTTPLASDRWHHLVGTHSRTGGTTTLELYVDGLLASTATSSYDFPSNGTEPLGLGYSPNVADRSWFGWLTQLAFYDHVLGPDRVLAHYLAMADRLGGWAIGIPFGTAAQGWS